MLHKVTYQLAGAVVIVRVSTSPLGTIGMKILKLHAALLGMALLASPVMAGQFYKWTDEQGVTHYSEDPPPKTAKNSAEVKVQTRKPSGAVAAEENLQKQREASGKTTADAAKDKKPAPGTSPAKTDKAQYAEKCKQYRSNLEAMEAHGRVSETNDKGEKRALTDEEKNQRMDETKRQIKAFCE